MKKVLSKPLKLLLLGAPGSGKGTQTSKLLNNFANLNSLSSGDILRHQISSGTKLGGLASSYIEEGKLVPDNLMVNLITKQLEQNQWLNGSTSWLLDGFPRSGVQAELLDKVLREHDANINMVVEMNVDQSVILQRIEARYVHIPSGRIYNLDYKPPKVAFKDDVTGEPLSKRADDTVEVFQRRLDLYNEEINSLREFYKKSGVLKVVSGNTSDEIYPKLEQLIANR